MDISKAAQFYHSDSKPLGKSYGEWTVEWWRWVYRLPKSVNPLIDSAGDLTIHNQSGKVWFLGGKPADKNDNLPIRNCSIPEDVSLLFPIINYEANQIEFPSLTEERLVEDVKEHMKLILKKDCYINGISIPGQRVKSNPFVYDICTSPKITCLT